MTPGHKAIPPHLQRRINASAKSAASTDNERALVLSTANTEDERPAPSATSSIISASIKHNFTQTELIQQDVIDALRSQVEHLTERCHGLEEENAHLRQTVDELAHLRNGCAMGGNRTHSLVGYGSSSDDSSTHDNLKEGPSAEYANQIAVILNRHEDRLANLEAHSTEIVTAALQGINIRPKHAAPNDDTTAGYDALAHRLESLELMLGSGLRQTNEHRIELQDLQDWRSHIENQQGNDRKQTTGTPAPQYDADIQARTERKIKQELRIDMTASRDELFQHYLELGELIQNYRDDGNFQGTDDDLWSLRERVITNIATFESREKALEEARGYVKYNSS